MSDELLLEKLDSYHHKLTDDAAARIRAQAARIKELEKALTLSAPPQGDCLDCAARTPCQLHTGFIK